MYNVIYQNGNINSWVDGSLEEIKSVMRSRFVELANVEPIISGSTLTFVVDNGRKAFSS